MRIAAIIVGVVLVAAGIWVVVGNGSYESTDTMLEIGSMSVKTAHDKAVPDWLGIAGIVVGAVLALGGFFGPRRSR